MPGILVGDERAVRAATFESGAGGPASHVSTGPPANRERSRVARASRLQRKQ
jgi:hypothetical protein